MYGPTPPVPPSTPPLPRRHPESGPYAGFPPGPAHVGRAAAPFPASGPFTSVVAVAPPRRSTPARVGLFALRSVLACVPFASIGILSWVPLLRTALVRRRAWDWVAVVVTALLAFWAFIAVGSSDSDTSVQCEAGMATLCLLALTSTVYFLVTELRAPSAGQPQPLPQPLPRPHPSPWPATPAAPLVPLGQVQAELDELSALLHQHDRPGR